MFTRLRPAAFSSSAKRGSSTPFVVREMSVSSRIARNWATNPGRPFLTSGSPPVMRTLVMPSCAAARTKNSMSS